MSNVYTGAMVNMVLIPMNDETLTNEEKRKLQRWQYGKWLITGYIPIKLHYRLSEVEILNNYRTSHLLYCVLWAAVLLKYSSGRAL